MGETGSLGRGAGGEQAGRVARRVLPEKCSAGPCNVNCCTYLLDCLFR